MSEGENKFLKLAWNTSQDKPSARQIVMKQTSEQGVIAGRGAAGSLPWRYLSRGGIAVCLWESLILWEIHSHHPTWLSSTPRVLCGCHSAVTEGKEGFKLGEFHLARGLMVGYESQESVLIFAQAHSPGWSETIAHFSLGSSDKCSL